MTITFDLFWLGFCTGWFCGISFVVCVALLATRRGR